MLKKLFEIKTGLLEVATSLFLWAILFFVSIQVFFRYVLRQPLMWPEELSRYLLIWMVFLGAVLLSKKDKHVKVEVFQNLLPAVAQRVLKLLLDLVIVLFLAVLLWGSGLPLKEFLVLKSPAMQLPLIFVFIVVPLSALLMFVIYLGKLVEDIRSLRGEEER